MISGLTMHAQPTPSALGQIAVFLHLMGVIVQFGVTVNPAQAGDVDR